MIEALAGILIGVIGSVLVVLFLKRGRRSGMSVKVHGTIDEMKAIGELQVFKVVTKEIVTAKDHMFGTSGTKYFEWFLSSNKMAMIFEFDIKFSFDLKDSRFDISRGHDGGYRFTMPPCRYDLHIKDMEFYDEQRSRLLPKLVPEILGELFSSGFGEAQRNELKDAAKQQAEVLAKDMVGRLMSEVRGSAEATLCSIAKSFGVTDIAFDYSADDKRLDARDVAISTDLLPE